jgi:hypothetical protein
MAMAITTLTANRHRIPWLEGEILILSLKILIRAKHSFRAHIVKMHLSIQVQASLLPG